VTHSAGLLAPRPAPAHDIVYASAVLDLYAAPEFRAKRAEHDQQRRSAPAGGSVAAVPSVLNKQDFNARCRAGGGVSAMFTEVSGMDTGCARAKCGSMHIVAMTCYILGKPCPPSRVGVFETGPDVDEAIRSPGYRVRPPRLSSNATAGARYRRG